MGWTHHGWRIRHHRVLTDWAVATGITDPASARPPDCSRLAEMGLRRMTALERAASRAGQDDALP